MHASFVLLMYYCMPCIFLWYISSAILYFHIYKCTLHVHMCCQFTPFGGDQQFLNHLCPWQDQAWNCRAASAGKGQGESCGASVLHASILGPNKALVPSCKSIFFVIHRAPSSIRVSIFSKKGRHHILLRWRSLVKFTLIFHHFSMR